MTKKPLRCCHPNCFRCPYNDCRYDRLEPEDYTETNQRDYDLYEDSTGRKYHKGTDEEYRKNRQIAIQTLDTSNRYGLVTAFITKFYKSGTGQEVTEPLHTITTSAGHFGLVSCFLLKYYGSGGAVGVDKPLDTLTTKDRFGLVSVMIDGKPYAIGDIRLRMLKPEEQKLCQEFPEDYIIDHDLYGKPYPITQQVHNIGNSVVPLMAKLLAESNRPDLIVAERTPNMRIATEQTGQLRFA